ncbi:hypothetical protein NMY22_g16723 [Coprinellus aureogranulatus]|nr:hypothetical protein NMY22_g16723 [Coprinellus aureogranulatus]
MPSSSLVGLGRRAAGRAAETRKRKQRVARFASLFPFPPPSSSFPFRSLPFLLFPSFLSSKKSNTRNHNMSLTLTSLTRTLTARFKPHRTEAIARIRFNAFSFLVLLLVTSIVPGLPSLPTAIATVAVRRSGLGLGLWRSKPPRKVLHYHHHHVQADEGEGVWGWVCLVEASLTAIFLFNIFESLYALKYPRAPSPSPSSSSASSLGLKRANQGSQPKKIFDGVHIGSTAGSTGSGIVDLESATSKTVLVLDEVSQGLPQTPPGTPSPPLNPTRSLHYSPLSTPRSSINSSTSSSVMYTPSPTNNGVPLNVGVGSVSGYRGRAFGGSTARPLDGSYLGRIVKTEADDDDD